MRTPIRCQTNRCRQESSRKVLFRYRDGMDVESQMCEQHATEAEAWPVDKPDSGIYDVWVERNGQ
jgi:hypothetical protein